MEVLAWCKALENKIERVLSVSVDEDYVLYEASNNAEGNFIINYHAMLKDLTSYTIHLPPK